MSKQNQKLISEMKKAVKLANEKVGREYYEYVDIELFHRFDGDERIHWFANLGFNNRTGAHLWVGRDTDIIKAVIALQAKIREALVKCQ